MTIKVKDFTTEETMNYREKKYQEFLELYFNTELKVSDIFEKIGVNRHNQTGHYIMSCLKKEGFENTRRWGLIKQGVWL